MDACRSSGLNSDDLVFASHASGPVILVAAVDFRTDVSISIVVFATCFAVPTRVSDLVSYNYLQQQPCAATPSMFVGRLGSQGDSHLCAQVGAGYLRQHGSRVILR